MTETENGKENVKENVNVNENENETENGTEKETEFVMRTQGGMKKELSLQDEIHSSESLQGISFRVLLLQDLHHLNHERITTEDRGEL